MGHHHPIPGGNMDTVHGPFIAGQTRRARSFSKGGHGAVLHGGHFWGAHLMAHMAMVHMLGICGLRHNGRGKPKKSTGG